MGISEVEALLEQHDFVGAKREFDALPDSQAKDEYAEMFYRVWSYEERVGLNEMGGE